MGYLKRFPSIVRFVRRLFGGSQPVLAEADDGLLYVVKFTNNPQGPHVLFNEALGTEVYRALGLHVPNWTPLHVSPSVIDRNRSCWMRIGDESVQQEPGICFGSQCVEAVPLEFLPGTYFERVQGRDDFWLAWLIDAICLATDGRQTVFERGSGGRLIPYFIDFGYMFQGAKHQYMLPKSAQEGLNCASLYWDRRIYGDGPTTDILSRLRLGLRKLKVLKMLGRIPSDWAVPNSLYMECLIHLQDQRFSADLFESLVFVMRMRNEAFRAEQAQAKAGLYREPAAVCRRLQLPDPI